MFIKLNYVLHKIHLYNFALLHLPIFGTAIGGLILLYSMYAESYHTKMAGYGVLLLAAVGGILAFSSGEAAEETVQNILMDRLSGWPNKAY